MVIGILHTTFAIYLLSQFIKSPGYLLVYLSCGILIIVYLILYFNVCHLCADDSTHPFLKTVKAVVKRFYSFLSEKL